MSEQESNRRNYAQAKEKGAVFTVRMPAQDAEQFTKMQEQSGKGKAELLRSLIRGITVVARPTAPTREMVIALNLLGNNLNQIAHVANINHQSNKINDDVLLVITDQLIAIQKSIDDMKARL